MNITNYMNSIFTPSIMVYATIINIIQYDNMDWCYDKSLVYDGFYEEIMERFMLDKTSVILLPLNCKLYGNILS